MVPFGMNWVMLMIKVVPRRRLELPRPCGHRYLKPARLPIPPPGQPCVRERTDSGRAGDVTPTRSAVNRSRAINIRPALRQAPVRGIRGRVWDRPHSTWARARRLEDGDAARGDGF